MNTQTEIDDFLNSKGIAVIGVSLAKKKFGNVIFEELKKSGRTVYGINNKVTKVTGNDVFPDIKSLPEPVEAAVINVSASASLNAVQEAHKGGVKRVWIQQGAQSPESLQYCLDNSIPVINNMCILMFALPGRFPHNFHKWINKMFGKQPK